ncbi:hypothetical protein Bca4012_052988 [Brassica carinata]|uniref:Bulb-type lectin domain-containing protein n=1 Tax=Brassica carinata TaxID=52824 RepID=A0A8X7UMW4_BRACI|nr:hypothetical protein Bca52824_055529 [Brassica carinata]
MIPQFKKYFAAINESFFFSYCGTALRKIQPNGGFSLSIWFYKTPNTTIVWHAQDVNTTSGLVPAGSKVTLTADRGLVLADPRGQRLWSYSLNPSNGSV